MREPQTPVISRLPRRNVRYSGAKSAELERADPGDGALVPDRGHGAEVAMVRFGSSPPLLISSSNLAALSRKPSRRGNAISYGFDRHRPCQGATAGAAGHFASINAVASQSAPGGVSRKRRQRSI